MLACTSSRSIRHITSNKLPEITKDKEVFDRWDVFIEGNEKGIKIVQNGNKADTLYTTTSSTNYLEARKDEGYFFIIYKKRDSSIYVIDYWQNPFFAVYKEFYPNGNIKTKGIHCYFGFDIGEWYHFDENGTFVSSENKDEGYCSYKKVFLFCQKQDIPLKRSTSNTLDIHKVEEDKKIWKIGYIRCCYHSIQLVGKTGTKISYELYDMLRCRCSLTKKQKRQKIKHIPVK